MRALCSEAILLIQVSDFSGHVSDITTEFVVPETPDGTIRYSVCTICQYQLKYST